jgi:hypothetical protein
MRSFARTSAAQEGIPDMNRTTHPDHGIPAITAGVVSRVTVRGVLPAFAGMDQAQ